MLPTAINQILAFGGEESCIDCVSGTEIPDWQDGKKVLAIVHNAPTAEQGLFVYKCPASVQSSKDLGLEKILPIRADFKYDIETRAEDQSIIQVRLSTSEASFVVEVPFESKSSNFFGNLKKCSNVSIEKTKKAIPQNFRWLQKYQSQLKPSISTTRPNTVSDPFGMSTFDATASPQYVNLNSKDRMDAQRKTVTSDTRTQNQLSAEPSYINAPHDPWEGLTPLVQFGTEEDGGSNPLVQLGTVQGSSAHPKAPPPAKQAWSSLWSPSEWSSTFQSPAWPTNAWPLSLSSNSSNSTGIDAKGFEDSFNDMLTLDSSSEKDTLTTTQQTVTTGSLSSLSVPSSSSSSSLTDPPDANALLKGHSFDGYPEDDYDELRPSSAIARNNRRAVRKDQSFDAEYDELRHVSGIARNRRAVRHSQITDETVLDAAGYAEVRPVARFRPVGVREEVLKKREEDYTFLHDFRVFVGTWNVNGQEPTEDLFPWLGKDAKAPDLYAVGFQELDLSKEAFLFNDSVREEEWVKAMDKALSRVGTYIRVKVIRLVGMMLTVYVQERHVPFISEVMAEMVGTGIMGKMGNKGGVSVRFEFHNTSFCFVNTHLAAHMDEFERRNQDYHDICNRMIFEWEDNFRVHTTSIREHDVVVWMGDLNYRISGLELEVVKKLIERRDFPRLLKHDQLFQQLELQKVFVGFKEGPIGFQPTYKFDPGSDDWDTSEKQRVPAWCDRILFKGAIRRRIDKKDAEKSAVKQKAYRNHMEMKLSDHKPVSSLFDVSVKVVDEKAFKQVVEEEIRKNDRQENETMPQVTLSTNNVEFDEVSFMESQFRTLDVANTGQVNTEFQFANKLDDKHFCKPFLKVEPSSVFLMPGDSTEVKITVLVDKNTAASLNSGEDTLEDILVLHLDNGKDYYITVSGVYKPSTFGCSIEALVMMHPPITELTPKQVYQLEAGNPLESTGSSDEFAKFDIPKEVWMLVDHLFRNATCQEELFGKEGLHHEVMAIRKCLDDGMPDSMPGGIHSIAEALLIFLNSLREPVIPYKFYDKCLECCNNFTLCKMVLKQIPKSHRNVFKYLAAFIRELLLHNDENKLDAKTLATVFGETFLRTPESMRDSYSIRRRTQSQLTARKKATFVYHFIINEYDD